MVFVFGFDVPLIELIFTFAVLTITIFFLLLYASVRTYASSRKLEYMLAREKEDLELLEKEIRRHEEDIIKLEGEYLRGYKPKIPIAVAIGERAAAVEMGVAGRRAALEEVKAKFEKAKAVDHIGREIKKFYESGTTIPAGNYVCIQCGHQQQIKEAASLTPCATCHNTIFKLREPPLVKRKWSRFLKLLASKERRFVALQREREEQFLLTLEKNLVSLEERVRKLRVARVIKRGAEKVEERIIEEEEKIVKPVEKAAGKLERMVVEKERRLGKKIGKGIKALEAAVPGLERKFKKDIAKVEAEEKHFERKIAKKFDSLEEAVRQGIIEKDVGGSITKELRDAERNILNLFGERKKAIKRGEKKLAKQIGKNIDKEEGKIGKIEREIGGAWAAETKKGEREMMLVERKVEEPIARMGERWSRERRRKELELQKKAERERAEKILAQALAIEGEIKRVKELGVDTKIEEAELKKLKNKLESVVR